MRRSTTSRAVDAAAQEHGVEVLLRLERRRRAARPRLGDRDAAVESPLLVGDVDHPVDEAAQENAVADLQDLDGTRRGVGVGDPSEARRERAAGKQGHRLRSRSEFVGGLDEAVGEILGDLEGLVLLEPVLGDQAGEEAAVDAPRHVVAGRDRQEGAGVVVEADGVVEAGGLGHRLAVAAHALRAVVEPPGRAELQRRVMAGQRRQLARIGGLVEGEEDDREVALVAEPVEQRLQRRDIVGRARDVGTPCPCRRS